jgi:hypothetical protein
MRVSWKGAVLAPLLVPLVCGGAAVVTSFTPHNPLAAFLFFFVPASVISYGTMIFLFLPCLYVVSKYTALTLCLTSILGAAVGALWFVPLIWGAWISSGPDSGPPEDSFIEFFVRWISDPSILLFLVFPIAGLITAAAYWFLSDKLTPQRDSVRPMR